MWKMLGKQLNRKGHVYCCYSSRLPTHCNDTLILNHMGGHYNKLFMPVGGWVPPVGHAASSGAAEMWRLAV